MIMECLMILERLMKMEAGLLEYLLLQLMGLLQSKLHHSAI
ncbi:unnamed protein product [Brassica napus]|uniref:(rape) hypothetical protein n=1 Tax=Brassica napus TaxID=3708 RepID=A0A816SQU0_BRANA|nr:unnamed protein product [Brassica napus]